MIVTHHSFSGETDKLAMLDLARAYLTGYLHIADIPYRLSSWAFDYPENVGLWVNDQDQLVAWAVLQTPFWTIDYALHPNTLGRLLPNILAWADQRALQVCNTHAGHPTWFINVFADQAEYIHDLEADGFTSQSDVGEDSWTQVSMKHSGHLPDGLVDLSPGFTLRPLLGETEVQAYVELHHSAFETENMTDSWRQRTLHHLEYIPDLDLVVVAPDGRLAAFCICWLNPIPTDNPNGQVEPLGVHSDFRGLGLGRAILIEGLRRLFAHGIIDVCVETDKFRNAALNLYESVGFRVLQDVLVYRKDYVSE